MNLALVAGGTGGHLMPGIAVAQALRDSNNTGSIFFVGTGTERERNLVEDAGFDLEPIPAQAVHGKGVLGLCRLFWLLPRAMWASISVFRKRRPDVVMGFGGYPSFIPVVVARLLGIPTVIHESNVSVGLANKVLGLIAKKTFAIHGAHGFFSANRLEFLANPVRAEFYTDRDYPYPQAGKPIHILVVGGSQGAVSLNSAVVKLVELFTKLNVHVTHQTGELDYDRV